MSVGDYGPYIASSRHLNSITGIMQMRRRHIVRITQASYLSGTSCLVPTTCHRTSVQKSTGLTRLYPTICWRNYVTQFANGQTRFDSSATRSKQSDRGGDSTCEFSEAFDIRPSESEDPSIHHSGIRTSPRLRQPPLWHVAPIVARCVQVQHPVQ